MNMLPVLTKTGDYKNVGWWVVGGHRWGIPDSKVHGANMRPIWGRQDPGGPHVGPMNFHLQASSVLRNPYKRYFVNFHDSLAILAVTRDSRGCHDDNLWCPWCLPLVTTASKRRQINLRQLLVVNSSTLLILSVILNRLDIISSTSLWFPLNTSRCTAPSQLIT